MNHWSKKQAKLFCVACLLSSAAYAAEPEIIMGDKPAISVNETKAVSANSIGLLSPVEAALPDNIWKNLSDKEIVKLLRGMPQGIASTALRSAVSRALLLQSEPQQSEDDMIAERIDALLKLGKIIEAEALLKAVPAGFQKSRQRQQQFLFNVMQSSDAKKVCAEATENLAAKPNPFWQRWVVACQAKAGERDKAQLGMDMLNEQSQSSEFYQKILQGMLTKKPAVKLPETIFFEQVALLYFAGEVNYLNQLKAPPLAYAARESKRWPALTNLYGLTEMVKAPTDTDFTPSMAYLKIPKENATAKDKRIAFLAYGLRKTFGQPVSIEMEQELLAESYEAAQIVASPSWRESVKSAAAATETGRLLLLLGNFFHADLNHYNTADIVLAVTALKQSGLNVEANALAKEALENALKA